eukprot:1160382-Pelagomonas_calceolata.AAC.9
MPYLRACLARWAPMLCVCNYVSKRWASSRGPRLESYNWNSKILATWMIKEHPLIKFESSSKLKRCFPAPPANKRSQVPANSHLDSPSFHRNVHAQPLKLTSLKECLQMRALAASRWCCCPAAAPKHSNSSSCVNAGNVHPNFYTKQGFRRKAEDTKESAQTQACMQRQQLTQQGQRRSKLLS